MRRLTIAVFLFGLFAPSATLAQNTTKDGAYSLMPGAAGPQDYLSPTTPDRWYRFYAVPGRSYCVETQAGWNAVFQVSAPGTLDTKVAVFRQDQFTVITTNDDAGEPQGFNLSRACFVAPGTPPTPEITYIQVFRFQPTGAADFWFAPHVTETTLFSNWFILGTGYDGYTLIRNTTTGVVNPATGLIQPLSYTVNWRNGAGDIVGTYSSTLPANGSFFVTARTNCAGCLAAGTGTVEIVHDGSPDAIVASTTVLSATTGLSFDAPFIKRQNY